MATYGEIRRRLSQTHPGISLDLLDGWIIDRYQEILDELTWNRLNLTTTLVTPAEYSDATLTATAGSSAVTGDSTAWTAAMTGRIIRIAAETDYYMFTRTSDTAGTLDREYTGDGGADLEYRINQNVFLMDSDVRLVRGIRTASQELKRLSVDELRKLSPDRNEYGAPAYWAWYHDAFTDPPVIQVELLPVPTEVTSLYIDVVLDKSGITSVDTSASLLPWTRPSTLIAGVEADIYAHLKDFNAATLKEARFNGLVGKMRRIEAESDEPTQLHMSPVYTRHQNRRWQR